MGNGDFRATGKTRNLTTNSLMWVASYSSFAFPPRSNLLATANCEPTRLAPPAEAHFTPLGVKSQLFPRESLREKSSKVLGVLIVVVVFASLIESKRKRAWIDIRASVEMLGGNSSTTNWISHNPIARLGRELGRLRRASAATLAS